MRTLAAYLRGLDPHLPRTVWLVQAGGVVNSLGNGIVFPFAIIYLHNVRGISFAQAGFALAVGGRPHSWPGSAPARSSTGSAAATRSSSACSSNWSRSRSSR
jgi:hypothetical protein